MSKVAVLILFCFSLSSCALFKRNRVHEHNGIERTEFNLPVFLYPSKIPSSKKLLIFLSGDGGWIEFEDTLSLKFAEKGFNTIGINSRSYFWDKKTPEQTEGDIVQLIRKYVKIYGTHQLYICGYSFGADVIPFIYNRLPPKAKKHLVALEMLSPYSTTDFKVKLSDLTNLAGDHKHYKVDKELEKVTATTYCFYGIDEDEKSLKDLKMSNFHVNILKGDHHYDPSEFDTIVAALSNAKK